jgi:hypothetical protein
MEFYGFPCIGNFIIPTDELHHFSEELVYHQPVNVDIMGWIVLVIKSKWIVKLKIMGN